MKLFVAGVMVVLASFVVADDVVWQTAEPFLLTPKVHSQEDVPAPVGSVASQTHEEVKTQNSQGNAGNLLPFGEPLRPDPREEQSDALSYQSMEQLKVAREANEIAARDNSIQERLVTVGWITIGTMVLLTFAQLYFVWTANQHAAAAVLAAKESVEVADRSMKVANRAYLFVREWEIIDFRENARSKVMCRLYNAGSTPATIEKRVAGYNMTTEVPPRFTPMDLRDKEKGEVLVNAQGNTEIVAGSNCFTTEEYRALQTKSLFLYVATCFIYSDVFDQQHWVVSSAKYDVDNRAFVVVDKPGYNCDGLYREEDWADNDNQ